MPTLRPRPCTGCSHPTTSRAGLCPSCKRDAVTGPLLRPCKAGCGKGTKAAGGMCPDCQRLTLDVGGTDDTEHALPAGDWRFDPFRRVQVYVPKVRVETLRDDEVAIQRQAREMAESFDGLPGFAGPDETPECAHEYCSNRFVPTKRTHLYCSERCKDAAYHLRRKAREAA